MPYYTSLGGHLVISGAHFATGVKFPEDGGDIVERRSKRGRSFWSCANYPNCKFATWLKPVAQKCPKCGAPFLGEKWTKGGEVTYVCVNKECDYKTEAKKEEPAAAEA